MVIDWYKPVQDEKNLDLWGFFGLGVFWGFFLSLILFEEETLFYSCHVIGCSLYYISWVESAFSTKLISHIWVLDLAFTVVRCSTYFYGKQSFSPE